METLLEKKRLDKTAKRMQPPKQNTWQQTGFLYLFVWLSLIYWELLLIPSHRIPITATSILYIVVFAASTAAVYVFLSSLWKSEKANMITLLVLLLLTALLFGVQYFCKRFFTNYMTIESLFTGAKGVISDFINVVIGMVLGRFWMVLLLLMPPFLLVVLRIFKLLSLNGVSGKIRLATVAVAVLVFCFARLLIYLNPSAQDRYTVHYEYNTAISSFGIGTATRLDLEYLVFGDRSVGFQHDPDAKPTHKTYPTDPTPPTDPTTPTDPITPTDPTAPTDPTDPPEPIYTEYGFNALNVDFLALAEAADDETVANIHLYISSLVPDEKNPYTGMFAGKNLILISAESFSKEAVNPVYTPTLYRMMTRGIQINNYYQPTWGASTTSGEFANMTGLIPTHGAGSMHATEEKDMAWTLGNQLIRQGYFSRAYHNHKYTFYDRNLTHENLGYEQFIALGNGLEDKITDQWPESDLEMMQVTVDDYIDHQPFSIYYMTVSGHGTYSWTSNSMSSKNRELVEDMDAGDAVKCYMAANIELDRAMEYLIQRLEEAGIADDTVIVLGTDHYPYALESNYSTEWDTALDELYGFHPNSVWERDHSALLIWSGCLEDSDPIVVDTPVYSLDITPTVSNLMGLPYDSRLMVGRDILSNATPLVIWPNHTWLTDKAFYDAAYGEVTVFEGYEDEVDEVYINNIRRMVDNRFEFSKRVLEVDYFRALDEAMASE